MSRTINYYLYDQYTGAPLKRVLVQAYRTDTGALVSTTATDANGLAAITGLDDAIDYKLVAQVRKHGQTDIRTSDERQNVRIHSHQDGDEGGTLGTQVATINDDAVYSFTPWKAIGVMLVAHREDTYNTAWGMVAYRTDASRYCTSLLASANFNVTTGVLAGTTGTDGKITVSTHTDGKVYIENRLGLAISINIILLGG